MLTLKVRMSFHFLHFFKLLKSKMRKIVFVHLFTFEGANFQVIIAEEIIYFIFLETLTYKKLR